MANNNIIKLISRATRGDELEEKIHRAFMRRQGLMWKHPIWDERITKIDLWLTQQHKVPVDILIAICSRASFCMCAFYSYEATPEQKHLILLSLKRSYQQFQKLPQAWQDRLMPLWSDWAAQFLEEEVEEARANGAA